MDATAAARIKRVAKAREAVHAAAERWHKVAGHSGPFDRCPERTCYHGNRMVVR